MHHHNERETATERDMYRASQIHDYGKVEEAIQMGLCAPFFDLLGGFFFAGPECPGD